MKQFYCRACKLTMTTEDGLIPQGWYSIARSWRTARGNLVRLGIFCSIFCLRDYLTTLEEEAKLIDNPRMAVPG